jgi:hypothetical protein
VRLFAKVGRALVAAREQERDPFAAIEAVVSWENFSASVREAEQLARDEDFNPISLLTEHYPQFRRYGPTLLEAFEFHPAPVARELIEAVNVLRQMKSRRFTQGSVKCSHWIHSKALGELCIRRRRHRPPIL